MIVKQLCLEHKRDKRRSNKKSVLHLLQDASLSAAIHPLSYGLVDLSTLLPMMPPRIAPAAPPMIAPFTLFLLVTAPITAPAPAPIAASRLVCFTTTGAGAGVYTGAEEYVPPEELLRRVVVVRRTGA